MMDQGVRIAVLALCVALSAHVHAARQALVIGNDGYLQIAALKNARADARAVAKALESAGFRVSLALDLNRNAMNSAVRRFKAGLSGGDEAVFFYAGHGVQLGGANYLLPVDMSGEDEDQIKDDAVHLQRVLDDLAEQKVRFSLAIIDACRDNPFKSKGRNFSTRGLAPTNAANGQMVIFSAGSGQQALDRLNDGDRAPNGLFTRVLLNEMARGGEPVDRVLKSVRTEVVRLAKSVGHDQVPAIYDQSIGDFYFRTTTDPDWRPTMPEASAQVLPEKAPVRKQASPQEQTLWDAVSATHSVDDYEAYLDRFPEGRYADDAKRAMATLKENHSAAQEKDAWSRAERLATAEGYRSFMNAHPESAYSTLAKSRLQRLERSRARELAACPTCPAQGDIWEYEFVDGFTGPKGNLTYTIQSAEQDRIVELIEAPELLFGPVSRRIAVSGTQAGEIARQKLKSSSDSWWLLEPGLYGVLAGTQKRDLRKGDKLEMSIAGRSCPGEVLADEDVKIPAGQFATRKIQFSCWVPGAHFNAAMQSGFDLELDLTVWVDPTRYRPVKIRKILKYLRQREDDVLQLVRMTRAGAAR